MSIFQKPFLLESERCTVVRADLEAIKQRGEALTWEELVGELKEALGDAKAGTLDAEGLMYSTVTSQHTFANRFTAKTLATIQAYEKAKALAAALQAAHDEVEAARPPEVVPEPQYDEEGELIEPKPKKRREIRAEQEARKADVERYQAVLDAQHAVSCLEGRMGSMAALYAIRVTYA